MIVALRNLARDESGGALIEYALILSLCSIVIYGALEAFGTVLADYFTTSSAKLAEAAEFAL